MSQNQENDQSGFTSGPRPGVEWIPDHECWELLGQAGFGRLALAAVGDIDIFPVNFAVDGQDVVIRTAAGTKLLEAVMSDLVAIEADDRDADSGVAWSVVAKGAPRMLERFDDIYQAERLGIRPWIEAVPKEHFIRVRVTRISGRRFRAAGPEPEDP
jgi:uncharacterized protein